MSDVQWPVGSLQWAMAQCDGHGRIRRRGWYARYVRVSVGNIECSTPLLHDYVDDCIESLIPKYSDLQALDWEVCE